MRCAFWRVISGANLRAEWPACTNATIGAHRHRQGEHLPPWKVEKCYREKLHLRSQFERPTRSDLGTALAHHLPSPGKNHAGAHERHCLLCLYYRFILQKLQLIHMGSFQYLKWSKKEAGSLLQSEVSSPSAKFFYLKMVSFGAFWVVFYLI